MSAHPSRIGRYEVLGVIGSGGMAEVLLGRLVGPSGFERPVVIKRILPHLARQQQFVDMFLDEARIVAGIHHQNVVQVHELGRESDELFLVMEYLEGESAAGVARRLSLRRKLLSFGLCAHVMAEVCAGLHAAHELKDPDGTPQNLVHRDMSPANIFVTYSGGVKILDFGIATASDRVSRTEAGQVKGKYAYMSPEQCMGHALDRRSDIFSLGIVLYELSTCRRLYKRASDMLTLQAICNEDAPPPSRLVANYPPELERICLRALQRDPAQRYPTALAMRRDLMQLSQELNGTRVPEESLSRVMQKIFTDRIEEKHAMLHRLREGVELTSVPSADTDSAFDLPELELSSAPSTSRPLSMADGSHSSDGLLVPELQRKKRLAFGLAAALLVAIGIGAWAAQMGDGQAEDRPMALQAPAPPPSSPPRPTRVKVSVESSPAGAIVLLGGTRRGETPTTLDLPRGSDPVEVQLQMSGHDPLVERVTPDVDQRIRVTLVKKAVAVQVPPPVAAPPPPPPPPPRAPPPPADPYKRIDDDPYQRFN